jgi:hypothetical protein
MMLQGGGPRGDEALRQVDIYEQMVDAFAKQSRAYWKRWGPLGEPILNGVEYWEGTQQAWKLWFRETYGTNWRP